MAIGRGGGGEITFPIGNATQGMLSQASGGPLSSPTLKDANQFSSAFIQEQAPLTTALQQICQKINSYAHVDPNTGKAYSAGQNLSNIYVDNKTSGKTFDGFALGR